MHDHIVDQIKKPHLINDNTLHIVGVISNSQRFHSRYRLYRDWAAHMAATPGVEVYTVETAFGDRHHEVTVSEDARHLQLRTNSEIWCKESMINLGVRYLLPRNFKYVAWVDCDVNFRDLHWAQETLHQLQHHDVVQPWQSAADLGPGGNIMQTFNSFGFIHQSRPGQPKQVQQSDPYPYGHSGFAWACTRRFWEACQGLLDFAILGSADHHMANAMVGDVAKTVHGGLGPSYLRRCQEWQRRAMRITAGQVGYVPGRIEHSWHGKKKDRGYQNRWSILVDHKFDPDSDLTWDEQGLIQLIGKPALEQAVLQYSKSRREDSVDEHC